MKIKWLLGKKRQIGQDPRELRAQLEEFRVRRVDRTNDR